ncbi:MAG TPA: SpoIVB peptidase [Firmicutes bacterium]|jgi:stage IV sporulation protein B|nr:SpoIVB peptidase [Bacillota bacterium]
MSNSYRKKNILMLAAFFLILFFIFLPLGIRVHLKDNIRIFEGQEHSYSLKFPLDLYIKADRGDILNINGSPISDEEFSLLGYHSDISLRGVSRGNVNLEISLFRGLIPIRQLTVSVLPEMKLVPGGHSIGIKLHEKGVLVVGYFYLNNGERDFSPAEEAGILIEDVIVEINDLAIDNIDMAADIIRRESEKGDLKFTVKRKGEKRVINVDPYLCSKTGEKRIGLYIRDTAAGVGTLTFYNPENDCYGALGHIITDLDTNAALEINDGMIVRADIVNIKTARKGQPGEKAGIFREGKDILGNIRKNCEFGIYGKLHNVGEYVTPYPDPIPLGLAVQVQPGSAELLTVVEGNKIQSFEIEIERAVNKNTPGDKGIILRIVDEELLKLTGGIVQGMSGSPIIQNGCLVGAVTHVFVNDPTRGYGIYAEWMVKEADIIPVS